MTTLMDMANDVTQWLVSSPTWLQLGTIIIVGVPVMAIVALALMVIIDVCMRAVAAISPK